MVADDVERRRPLSSRRIACEAPDAGLPASVRLVVRRLGSGQMHQVLDRTNSFDLACLLDDLGDDLGPLDLAAKRDDAVHRVDVQLALGNLAVAKDLAFDL